MVAGPRVSWAPVRLCRTAPERPSRGRTVALVTTLDTPTITTLPHVIGGAELAGSGETFESRDPHDGSVVSVAPRGTVEDARAAITAARTAFDNGPWPRMDPEERRTLLYALAALIEENADELALLESRDTGRLLSATRHHDSPRAA